MRRGRPSARERANVANTRSLIDKRGRQDAVVDDSACAARLNQTLIYLSFESKEEIFDAEFPGATDSVGALRAVFMPKRVSTQVLGCRRQSLALARVTAGALA